MCSSEQCLVYKSEHCESEHCPLVKDTNMATACVHGHGYSATAMAAGHWPWPPATGDRASDLVPGLVSHLVTGMAPHLAQRLVPNGYQTLYPILRPDV